MRSRVFVLLLLLFTPVLHAQHPAASNDPNEGIWQGYDGEWRYVSRLLLSLAEAIPADKYSWRPAPGVRSVSEVLMHIAVGNFYLLAPTGVQTPADLSLVTERSVTAKTDVMRDLKRSLDAVRTAHAGLSPADLQRKVDIEGQTATVDGMYLRILAHNNEHLGQLIAYARVNGITPPWSKP